MYCKKYDELRLTVFLLQRNGHEISLRCFLLALMAFHPFNAGSGLPGAWQTPAATYAAGAGQIMLANNTLNSTLRYFYFNETAMRFVDVVFDGINGSMRARAQGAVIVRGYV